MLVAAVALAFSQPSTLRAYALARDPATSWQIVAGRQGEPRAIRLTSQRWHGIDWTHDVVLQQPAGLRRRGICVVNVTGDRTGSRDDAESKRIADLAGMPVATLYQIPNQPLFGAKEDVLIAISFQRFLESGDATWPLLMPMAKSVIESMNAIQASTAKGKNPIARFVVTGGSKRGWTTWLAAATGDRRIVGAVPVVFDNLSVIEQMKHQKATMGDYSPMIRDYVESGMLDALETPQGRKLAALVDPAAYVKDIRIPVFLIHGGNDLFWAPDANSLYWSKLPMPKSLIAVPNAGHTLGDRKWMEAGIAAFADRAARGAAMPKVDASVQAVSGGFRFRARADGAPESVAVYTCAYTGWNFATSKWKVQMKLRRGRAVEWTAIRPTTGSLAVTAVAEHVAFGLRYWVSSPPIVIHASRQP